MAPGKKSAKPSGKTTKVVGYSVLALGGLALAYYLYERYESNAASGTTGSTSTPADTTPQTNTISSTAPAYGSATTLAAWKADVIQYLTTTVGIKGGENVAATAISKALNGQCLGPNEYAGLNAALGAIGQPPGTGTLTIRQCSQSQTPKTTTTAPGSANSTPHSSGSPQPTANRSTGASASARTAQLRRNAADRAKQLAANAARRRAQLAANAKKAAAERAKLRNKSIKIKA